MPLLHRPLPSLAINPAIILLLVLVVMALPTRFAWSCGPVHEWKPLREEQQPFFSPRAGDDVVGGLMFSLLDTLPLSEKPLGLVIVEVLDNNSPAADPRAMEKLEAALEEAAAADPGFSCIPSRSLLEYLRQEGLEPERLINPTISARAAEALNFDALIWFRIMEYTVTNSRCLDILEDKNAVLADIRKEKALVRSKVVDARTASIMWIDEQAGEYIYQNVFLVSGVTPAAGITVEASLSAATNSTVPQETTTPEESLHPENMVILPPEVSLELFLYGTTTELSTLPGLTVEIIEGCESYHLSPQKNRYWKPHDDTSH